MAYQKLDPITKVMDDLRSRCKLGLNVWCAIAHSWQLLTQEKTFDMPDLHSMLAGPLKTVYVKPEDARLKWYDFLSLHEQKHEILQENPEKLSEKVRFTFVEVERRHPGDRVQSDDENSGRLRSTQLQPIRTLAGRRIFGICFAAHFDSAASENASQCHLKASYPFQLMIRVDSSRLMLCYDCIAFKPSAWDHYIDSIPSEEDLLQAKTILGLNYLERRGYTDSDDERVYSDSDELNEDDGLSSEDEKNVFREYQQAQDTSKYEAIIKRSAIKLQVHAAEVCKSRLMRFRIPLTSVGGARLVCAADANCKNGKTQACLILDLLHAPTKESHPFTTRLCNPRGQSSSGFVEVTDWSPNAVASRASRHYIHGELKEVGQLAAQLAKLSPWIETLLSRPPSPLLPSPTPRFPEQSAVCNCPTSPCKLRKTLNKNEVVRQSTANSNDVSPRQRHAQNSPSTCPSVISASESLWNASPYNNPLWRRIWHQCHQVNTLDAQLTVSLAPSDAPPFRTGLFQAVLAAAAQANNGIGVPSLQSLSVARLLVDGSLMSLQSHPAVAAFLGTAKSDQIIMSTVAKASATTASTVRLGTIVRRKPKDLGHVMAMEDVEALLVRNCAVPVDRIERVNPCLKRAILMGHVTVEFGMHTLLHCRYCIHCGERLECTVADALWQSPNHNLGQTGLNCSICGQIQYITDLCTGKPHFVTWDKHNHCLKCPDFGTCMKHLDYSHCSLCGAHYFRGIPGFSCHFCEWNYYRRFEKRRAMRLQHMPPPNAAVWDGRIDGGPNSTAKFPFYSHRLLKEEKEQDAVLDSISIGDSFMRIYCGDR